MFLDLAASSKGMKNCRRDIPVIFECYETHNSANSNYRLPTFNLKAKKTRLSPQSKCLSRKSGVFLSKGGPIATKTGFTNMMKVSYQADGKFNLQKFQYDERLQSFVGTIGKDTSNIRKELYENPLSVRFVLPQQLSNIEEECAHTGNKQSM